MLFCLGFAIKSFFSKKMLISELLGRKFHFSRKVYNGTVHNYIRKKQGNPVFKYLTNSGPLTCVIILRNEEDKSMLFKSINSEMRQMRSKEKIKFTDVIIFKTKKRERGGDIKVLSQ